MHSVERWPAGGSSGGGGGGSMRRGSEAVMRINPGSPEYLRITRQQSRGRQWLLGRWPQVGLSAEWTGGGGSCPTKMLIVQREAV